MCGRYAASSRPEDLVEEFEVDATEGPGPGETPDAAAPDYNVAPTKQVPVVLERRPRPVEGASGEVADEQAAEASDEDGDVTADAAVEQAQDAQADGGTAAAEPVRWLRLLTWGLVPSWAKDRSVGNRMINARVETILDKPGFKRAALTRRCLVPADGWYEWQKSPTETDAKGKPRKQPFFIHPVAQGPIAFAGLYEFWRDPAVHPDDPAAWLTSFTIVTTAAEPGLDVIHDRMPLVLPRDRWDAWLDPGLTDADDVRALVEPPVAGRFLATAVSTRVNAVGNNGAELLEAVPVADLRGVVDPATGELIGGGSAPLF
ncbi:SOS response-associated peptidase [Kineosporia sp. A_224]|uniref:SOS response-associated peptidase n=1 Tax=Kineosporia sp. A_224 TaxID=1962180 RepID=UPI000B4BEBFE|nr:SOS response-associated peptidase [Kineosporia sp. A_224]